MSNQIKYGKWRSNPNNPFTLNHAHEELKKVVEWYAKEGNFNILVHFVEMAKRNPDILKSLIKKFIADKEKQEIVITDNRPLEHLSKEDLERYLKGELELVNGQMVEVKKGSSNP